MSYASPPTKNAGDLLTSALWNTYVKGNADSGFCRKVADSLITGSSVASITFSSIPATFAHLLLVVYARSTSGTTTFDDLVMQYNGDTTAAYDSSLAALTGQTSMAMGLVAGGGAGADRFATNLILIPNYADSSGVSFQTTMALSVFEYGSTWQQDISGGMWVHTNVINQILLKSSSGNLDIGTRATLYGLPE